MSSVYDNTIATIADRVSSDMAVSLRKHEVEWDDEAIDVLREWIADNIVLKFKPVSRCELSRRHNGQEVPR